MKKPFRWLVASLASLSMLHTAQASAATFNGSAAVKYKVLPSVKATITPNYQSGFGPTSTSGAGSGTTPAVGALAVLDGGTVDFGNVVAGYNYLYKYAASVQVVTNDTAGFIVYAEGSTDLNGSNPVPSPATFPIGQALYWLVSSSGNSPYSGATPFTSTSSPVSNGGKTITYAGAPPSTAIIWQSAVGGTITQGYDYELRLPSSIALSQFNVYVVYTVIGN